MRFTTIGRVDMTSMPQDHYGYLRQLVFSCTQNILEPSRDYLFETRQSRVLRAQGMAHLEELVQHLRRRRDPALVSAIAEAMTINETSFFRDVRPFDLLRTDLLPKLIEARRKTATLRFWSAACSTGREAYSLAMLLREHFAHLAAWNIRIEGTDIAREVVERARSGRYHRIEINRGLPARHIVRYFDHTGEEWTIKPEIRQLCSFRQANLCASRFPYSRADGRSTLSSSVTSCSTSINKRAAHCLPKSIHCLNLTESSFSVLPSSRLTRRSGRRSWPGELVISAPGQSN